MKTVTGLRAEFLVGAWIVLGLLGCEQSVSAPQPQASERKIPLIHFSAVEQNLGELFLEKADGHIVEFPFENQGNAPLTISRIVSSCGCTAVTASSKVVEPGATGKITAKFNSHNFGTRQSTISVSSTDPINSPVTLRVSWTVVGPFLISPERIEFGDVSAGATPSLPMTASAHESRPEGCQIENIKSNPLGALRIATLDGSDPAYPLDGNQKLVVHLCEPVSAGSASLVFQLTKTLPAQIVIPVTWHVQQLIETTPASVIMVRQSDGRAAGSVVVAVAPANLLEIASMDFVVAEGTAEVRAEELGDRRRLIKMVWTGLDHPGIFAGELRIVCTSPVQQTIRVPVSVYVPGEKP